MATVVLATQIAPSAPSAGQVSLYADSTTLRHASKNAAGNVTPYGYALAASSVVAVSAGYASDTYLAGSAITIPSAGDWSVSQMYCCLFDMTKTGAGTAAFTITIRMGTLGTVADAAILALAFGAGTANGDTGLFEVWATFRTVGSGTSAVLAGVTECRHSLAATGLVSTGASGIGIITGTSAGFNSTTQTVIGLSVNGGTSFSGTNTLVQAQTMKV